MSKHYCNETCKCDTQVWDIREMCTYTMAQGQGYNEAT